MIIDSLPFADFATDKELESARDMITEELANIPKPTCCSDVSNSVHVPTQWNYTLSDNLKSKSEDLKLENMNLELLNQYGTASLIQYKMQLTSLKERLESELVEIESELIASRKQRRLSQSITAGSIRQSIRQWNDLLENNGAAEIAVAKLEEAKLDGDEV
jgi:hypothetical protein